MNTLPVWRLYELYLAAEKFVTESRLNQLARQKITFGAEPALATTFTR
jgi:hypothetical protein